MLIVADYGNNRVKVVDSAGTVTNLYGVSSKLWIPKPPALWPGWADGDVTVRTQMVGRGSPSSIDYSLSNATGSWKVYDVQVEGISLVAAYRDEFTGLVSSDGVAGVIAALKKKNAK